MQFGTIAVSWAVCCVEPLLCWPDLSSWTGKCLRRAAEVRLCFKRICGSKQTSSAHLLPPQRELHFRGDMLAVESVRLSSTHGCRGKCERGSEYSIGSVRKVCNASGPWALQSRTRLAQSFSLTFLPVWLLSQEIPTTTSISPPVAGST